MIYHLAHLRPCCSQFRSSRLDLEVIKGIEAHRQKLRFSLNTTRRWRGQLRRNLRARAMRGSNSIEGYDISLDDAIAILGNDDDALNADQRTVLEVTEHRNAMTYVQQLAEDPDFHLDESLIRSLHFMMLGHDLDKIPGRYRPGSIFVRDEDRGETVYEGPDSDLVRPLMKELLDAWEHLDNHADEQPVFVVGAMAHLDFVMIHPFTDGNCRMARCLQTLMLSRNQILGQEFASIEEWLGRNTLSYYDVLARTGLGSWQPSNDAAEWVRFNLMAHHMQAQTVWRRVQISEVLWTRLEQIVHAHGLPDRVVDALSSASLGLRVRRSPYQEQAGIELTTANKDLRNAVASGLLTAQSQTPGRYYQGSESLRQLYLEIRSAHTQQIQNPYETQRTAVDDGAVVPAEQALFAL